MKTFPKKPYNKHSPDTPVAKQIERREVLARSLTVAGPSELKKSGSRSPATSSVSSSWVTVVTQGSIDAAIVAAGFGYSNVYPI
jgi:hypothetical protein